jgi:ubiquitin carboxyl-terminal hydrolase 5/13
VDKASGKLPIVIEGVMNAMTFSKKEEVKAWEQEFVPCEHTLCLIQQDNTQAMSTGIDSLKTHLGSVLT